MSKYKYIYIEPIFHNGTKSFLHCHWKEVELEAFSSKIWLGKTSMVKVVPSYYYPWNFLF